MAANKLDSRNRDYEHFAAVPWCNEHLKGATVTAVIPVSRRVKPDTEDSVFSQTLNTPETISAFILFYEETPDPRERVDEIKSFLTLNYGVNGFPGVCHGGIVTTILDEVLGLLIPINKKRNAVHETDYMTAYLNTTFIRPVPTPGTILATARIVKVEGRKYFLEGKIWDEKSTLLAKTDALFVALKSRL